MAKAARKSKKPAAAMIVFSRSRDIPFNRIRLSDSNVRETDVEAGLDDLTHDIDRREDIVQGINVRAILDADGNETGDFETPAGGRRFRAIARLVEAGRFPADGLVPCLVKKADAKTSAVDDSLAENMLRLGLHPLDQFRAFKRMFDDGMTKEEIADAYRTTPRYITQRMRLASVSPALLEVYARNGMPLAMLEAFTVNPDHARQEQVWEAVQRSYNVQPWQVRQLLTETTVPTDDKRVRFVGVEAYEQAGGAMLRDLFSENDGGWLEDVGLLDRLVSEKLKAIADDVAAEGWKWVAVETSHPYGYDNGLREITGSFADLIDEERVARDALRNEYDDIESEYSEHDELPEEIDRRLGEIEAALEDFEKRPVIYDPAEVARAGVFISIDRDGEPVIERGYVRPEDEPIADAGDGENENAVTAAGNDGDVQRAVITIGGQPVETEDDDDDDGIKPLPERLVIELTAHRTVALQEALANNPHVAMTALLHRMVMERYHYSAPTGCLEVSIRHRYLSSQGSDLADSPSVKAIGERFDAWKADLPSDEAALWDWIAALDEASRMALLAHCVSYGVNALYERPNPHSASGISQHGLDRRLAGADRIARATAMDMVLDAGWRPTVENYLGRVTKTQILAAVREGAGERAAQLIDHLKKGDMAKEAERLLADTGWLPEPLRLVDLDGDASADTNGEVEALPDFLAGDGDDEEAAAEDEEDRQHLVAAE
ncbi:chromosome partitioning protein ParB [Ochrobactrum sp. 30A/1000/2015]|uniref:Chromosome partitioning protein ParB n=1 Tax=Agrobacterium pusense TaxID=648995 RepID=A0A6H0ZUV7_9HYPH|nr:MULTISPECIES: chromosome partitioning protein ParB [Hyphomicrobiales]PJT18952.1 chromosome partitioning protein ParB [Ochrobactrum sp. 30A/1000/2015]PJT38902.1 chromosome partitioning protein ParB [Ochrobactrum sp. 27A/999/2015]PJT41104.1 chromosome partitioning protein ParB [Ochrobactrum sp. 23A/997/2015]MDH2091405.1 chromosome partitioning protein ParB [Agrobacterium pusense]QIX24419.1 chromosome partitioning protein ParB [Agrobacterium pusense]